MLPKKIVFFLGFGFCLTSAIFASAQTADQAWLRPAHRNQPLNVRALGTGTLEKSAVDELKRGLGNTGEIVVGTVREVQLAHLDAPVPGDLQPGGYWIYANDAADTKHRVVVAGADEAGVLYGAFALLRLQADGEKLNLHDHPLRSSPVYKIRWTEEWDNADGSVERGYAGRSIFFEDGKIRDDLTAVGKYARLLASVGINGCNVNNVNNAAVFLQPDMLKGLARVADAMRPWGVHLAMSVDIASPEKVGGLKTFDPADPAVQAWWKAKVDEVYSLIPDMAGITVKADSEGQPGPASYGRTPADAANTLAAALAPHGGVVMYRAFVYNHHLDWTDPKADRARAAYDIFHPLDGTFAPNVIVQIKEGPIDFQAREPVSPLFAGLKQTREAMELQITQEYLGQQRHMVYIAPMWKEVLDFDLRADGKATPVKAILAGRAFGQPSGGIVGVASVGRNAWLGSPMALVNLYAFGRLAWDPDLDPVKIAEEWTRQTLGNDPKVVITVVKMLMQSWPSYESYTGPLGLQTLTDITGSHYGPNVEASERNGWGQWHWADHEGVGMDRSVATGTGFAGQYPPDIAKKYELGATTPDDLVLFFHHVPYTYKLRDGKTVIQYIYDSHYDGAARAAQFVQDWESLKDKVDPALYGDVLARLQYQAGHAIVWRDAITQYFSRLSGISDEKGRVGNYPGRMEAEDGRLTGYQAVGVAPWEDASRGKAVTCQGNLHCSAEWTYQGTGGRFDVAVQYFDLQGGVATFALTVDGKAVTKWSADAALPSLHLHGDNSTRFMAHSVELKPGDVIRVEGIPDGSDPAALDYVEIEPASAQ
jgi:alpha-glucuronidase